MGDKPQSIERSSSFARSFYRGAENPTAAAAAALSQDAESSEDKLPIPRSRPMGRRQSSRRVSGSIVKHTTPETSSESVSAVASSPATEFPKSAPDDAVDMTEASKGGQELDIMQGTAKVPSETVEAGFGAFDDEEVLEQYRIMAQHEANLRVKENIGFDLNEYERRRKLQPSEPTDKRLLYGGGKKTKTRLPEPKKLIAAASTPKPEEPPLPTPTLNIKFLHQAQARVPELCPGVTVRGGANVPHDEHIVRCLGCRGQVRVKILATLVSCPDCNTVSPASSTRR
jgi:hypothetical protein